MRKLTPNRPVNTRVHHAILEKSKTKGPSRMFLLILATWADNHGRCYPGIELIAACLNVSVRAAQYTEQKLVRAGELSVESGAGPRGQNVYTVCCVAADFKPQPARPATRQKPTVKPAPKPAPVQNRHEEPRPKTSPERKQVTTIQEGSPILSGSSKTGENQHSSHTQQAAKVERSSAPPCPVQALSETGDPLTQERREYYASILAKIITPEAYRRRIQLNKTQLRALRNRMNTGGLPWPRPGSWLDAQLRRPL